jgi:hypothetical protein
MMAATILIPTFDHGPAILAQAIASAQAQSVTDTEIFVVGDGAPPESRAAVEALAAADPRLRYFDNPKGEARGERHRHRALQAATGEIVCYLADDDLWFPDHVEIMRSLLAEADFANGLPGQIDGDGRIQGSFVDLALPYFKRIILERANRIPTSFGAHRLDFYRRLPQGWGPAPGNSPSDWHMWRQILAMPNCRTRSAFIPTGICLPSPQRRHMTVEQRAAELARWRATIADPLQLARLRIDILAQAVARAGREAEDGRILQERSQPRPPGEIEAARADLVQRLAQAEARIALLQATLAAAPPSLFSRAKIALARVPYLRAARRRLRGRPAS